MSEEDRPQSVTVQQGNVDADMLAIMVELKTVIPSDAYGELFGYANPILALGHFTPLQARIEELRLASAIDLAIMSVPRWKVSPHFLNLMENLENLVLTQIWRATDSQMVALVKHVGNNPQAFSPSPGQQERRKRFGIF